MSLGLTERIPSIMKLGLPRAARVGLRGLAAVLFPVLVALAMVCHRAAAQASPLPSDSSKAIDGATKDTLVITISSDGTINFQDKFTTADDLQKKLAEISQEKPQTTLAIRADKETPWAAVVKVMDAAKASRINVVAASVKKTSHADWPGKQKGRPLPMRPPRMLAPAEVDALEAKLVEDPEDFSARIDLITYYGFRDRAAKARHVLWIIEHHPEFSASGHEMSIDPVMDGSAYRRGKALWLQHVKDDPANTVFLGNAAAYFNIYDNAAAEEMLTKAQNLQPENPDWSEKLGQLYKLEMNGHPGTNLAAKALREFEKAQAQTVPPVPGEPRLANLAQMAVAAGDFQKARAYATELLGPGMQWSGGGNAGRAFFFGNLVLGRVALHEGNLAEAKKYLLEAGKTKGDPTLNSFGPNMSLAKELLEKGETNAVLEFFQECEKFWPSYGRENKMAKWTAEVKEGKTPDFGGNLYF